MAPPLAVTTLDLARAIADAVLAADMKGHGRDRNGLRDKPTQAVFGALERAGCWFMRVDERADGSIRSKRALGEQSGVCRWCGCTESTPCVDSIDGACSWVNRSHTLCSACAGIERLLHTTRGRGELLTAWSALTARIALRAAMLRPAARARPARRRPRKAAR